jgi:hypothetical protein
MLKLGESLNVYFYITWCGVLAMGKCLVVHRGDVMWQRNAGTPLWEPYFWYSARLHICRLIQTSFYLTRAVFYKKNTKIRSSGMSRRKKAIAIYAFMAHEGWSLYSRRKRPQYPFNRRLGGPHIQPGRSGEINIPPLSGFKPLIVQSIA